MPEPGRSSGLMTLECIGVESPSLKRPIEAFDYLVGRIDVVAPLSLEWRSFMKVLDTVPLKTGPIAALHIRQGNGSMLVSVTNAIPLYFSVQLFGDEKLMKVLVSFGYRMSLLTLVKTATVSLLDTYLPAKVRMPNAWRR
jgi:hypothetical protein